VFRGEQVFVSSRSYRLPVSTVSLP